MSRNLLLITLALTVAITGCSEEKSSNAQMSEGLKACLATGEGTANLDGLNCMAAAIEKPIRAGENPRLVIPRVEPVVTASSPQLQGLCHVAMHKVGRDFARENEVTLTNLRNYLPSSNSLNCGAGFTHGMISVLGIRPDNSQELLAVCAREPTRARQTACAHGIGHGLRRTMSNEKDISKAVAGCAALGTKGASDCSQGVFHDFYMSIQGQDETSKPLNANQNGTLCPRQKQFQAECWYNAFPGGNFLMPSGKRPQTIVETIKLACKPLSGQYRIECVKGMATASIDFTTIPKTCRQFKGNESIACVSGSYLIGSVDDKKKWNEEDINIRSGQRRDIINQCLNMPSGKAAKACVYWMAYNSLRSFAGPITSKQARLVCTDVKGQFKKLCLGAVRKAQSKDLRPLTNDPTRAG